MKYIYVGSSGSGGGGSTLNTGRVELLDQNGNSLNPKKYAQIAVKGANATGDAPRTLVVEQAETLDQP